MAEIEIAPLSDRLDDEQIADLVGGLEGLGAPRLPKAAEDASYTLGDAVDDDALSEFLDRLEAHDMACEIYLPVEFEGRVEVADLRVGSAASLLEVLEELKDELSIDDDEDFDEDDYDDEETLFEARIRHVWKLFADGAQMSIDRKLPLHLTS